MPHYCPISSHYGWNLDGLMDMVFDYLKITRVYTKPKGQVPDYSAPVILRGIDEPSVEIFCAPRARPPPRPSPAVLPARPRCRRP